MTTITPDVLCEWARGNEHDNYAPGEAGYCSPDEANWSRADQFPVSMLMHLMDDWDQWFRNELQMDEEEGLGREWASLITEEIRDEIVVLVRDGKGYIWDGWHRAAAVIMSGRQFIPAIVGTPAPRIDCGPVLSAPKNESVSLDM